MTAYGINAVDKYGVSYAPIIAPDVKISMTNEIEDAISNLRHFYIGVAKELCTSSLQSLCNRVDSRCPTTGAKTCNCPCHHAADERAGDMDLRLDKLLYSDILVKNTVCSIERDLIYKYKDTKYNGQTLCMNQVQSAANGNCITKDKGIVYLRIYT